jgi:hypothetical protein
VGGSDDIERVIADWGSDEPQWDAVRLTDEASHVARFLTIPTEFARERQGDSPFAEVIAINAAARRSRCEPGGGPSWPEMAAGLWRRLRSAGG